MKHPEQRWANSKTVGLSAASSVVFPERGPLLPLHVVSAETTNPRPPGPGREPRELGPGIEAKVREEVTPHTQGQGTPAPPRGSQATHILKESRRRQISCENPVSKNHSAKPPQTRLVGCPCLALLGSSSQDVGVHVHSPKPAVTSLAGPACPHPYSTLSPHISPTPNLLPPRP